MLYETVIEVEKNLNCGSEKMGWRPFGMDWLAEQQQSNLSAIIVYLSLSVFISGLSLFALYFYQHHYPFNPLSLLSYHLSSSCQHVSPPPWSPAARFLPVHFLFSGSPCLLSMPSHFLCSPSSRRLPFFPQIKSWVLSPPLVLKDSHSTGGSAGEMDLPSLFLWRGGCSGDNSEPTSISISRTEQRPAQPSTPPSTHSLPRITFHCLLFFQVAKTKVRQRDRERKGWAVSKERRKRGMI